MSTSSEAYRVFVAELGKDLRTSEEYLSGSTSLPEECRRQLATCFHRIKGGAGFFGLDDLRRLAGSLEEQVQAAVDPAKLQDAFAEFRRICQKVPPPCGGK